MRAGTLRLDRRSLLTAAAGMSLGMVAVGGFAAADAIVRAPSLTLIGEDAAQFALLRTQGAKLGFLFGPPTSKLLAAIVPLLGWTAPAFDLFAVSPAALTETTGEWLTGQSHVRALILLGPIIPSQMPVLRPGVQARVLTTAARTSLAQDVAVEFRPAFSSAAIEGSATNINALVTIRRRSQTIVLLDDPAALAHQPGTQSPSLLTMPAGDPRQTVATFRPGIIAINDRGAKSDQVLPADLVSTGRPIGVLRTFVNEPAVITIADGELRLPPWTKVIGPGTPAAIQPSVSSR